MSPRDPKCLCGATNGLLPTGHLGPEAKEAVQCKWGDVLEICVPCMLSVCPPEVASDPEASEAGVDTVPSRDLPEGSFKSIAEARVFARKHNGRFLGIPGSRDKYSCAHSGCSSARYV